MFGWVSYKITTDIQWIVDIKYILFTDFTRDQDLFKKPLQVLDKFGFKYDSSELKRKWDSLISNEVDYVKKINKDLSFSTEVERAKSLVLLFSKNGGGGCLGDIDLLDKLLKLSDGNGYGCCTDHTEVFIALSSFFGLVAREVHTLDHVTNEYYDQELKKWIWIDPLFAIMARNQSGEYLSLLEVRNMYDTDEKVYFEFFGNEFHFLNFEDPYFNSLYDDKEDISDIKITLGNNVFDEDNFNHRLYFLPRFLRQFVGISFGITPSYLMYVDNKSQRAKVLHKKKYTYIGVFILLFNGTIFFPSYVMIEKKFRYRKHV